MNEIMPFAATQMGLEMIILSEVSQEEKDIPITDFLRHCLKGIKLLGLENCL